MRGNGLWQIHIVFPVDCVWPLCTAMAGNCFTRTAKNRPQAQPNARKNRLAVMYRMAVHNVKTGNCAILLHFDLGSADELVSNLL